MGEINLNQFLRVVFGGKKEMGYKFGVFWWRSPEEERIFVPFAHTRAYIKSKASRIGDMWTDRENFIKLMKAMGYKNFHKHMAFVKKRERWDNLAIPFRKLKVPKRYFEIIGVKEGELLHAVRLDQEEYLEALRGERVPEYFVVIKMKWLSERREFPGAMAEEEALSYVLRYLEENYPEEKRGPYFRAEIVFPRGLKTIYIGRNLKWSVSYNYPDLRQDRGYYCFFYNRKLPAEAAPTPS